MDRRRRLSECPRQLGHAHSARGPAQRLADFQRLVDGGRRHGHSVCRNDISISSVRRDGSGCQGTEMVGIPDYNAFVRVACGQSRLWRLTLGCGRPARCGQRPIWERAIARSNASSRPLPLPPAPTSSRPSRPPITQLAAELRSLDARPGARRLAGHTPRGARGFRTGRHLRPLATGRTVRRAAPLRSSAARWPWRRPHGLHADFSVSRRHALPHRPRDDGDRQVRIARGRCRGASGHERESAPAPAGLPRSVSLVLAPVRSALEAQGWPEQTATLLGGRVTLGGEVTATVAPDDDGHFNYTDYERSALQLVRLGVTAAVRPIDRLTFVVDLRAEGDTSGGDWSAIPGRRLRARAAVARPPLRHPGGPHSAGVRRRRPPHLRQRQRPHRLRRSPGST